MQSPLDQIIETNSEERMAEWYGRACREDILADEMEQEIARLIGQNSSEDYEPVLGSVKAWQPFYHLSSMRKGLFYWYDFEEDASLLEVGAGFGALTGLFCDRCRMVVAAEADDFRAKWLLKRYHCRENLCVYHGDLPEPGFTEIFPEKFDYIVVTDLLGERFAGSGCRELYTGYLKKLAALLKPSGHLLLAVDNRYGIRYFCGAPDPYTGRPFDGINRYPFGSSGYAFSRQELISIMEQAGLRWKLYYPLPDYRLVQLIYSDAYMQGSSIRERLVPYYTDSSGLVAYEKNLYDDLMENHVLHFFANAFLAECTVQGDFCPVIYAALSTDRGKEHGFATTLRADGTAEKICLDQAGIHSMKLILENSRQLARQGIRVVEHHLSDHRLRMPWIKAPTLSNVLHACVFDHPEQFHAWLDLLYEKILQSSEHVPDNQNFFLIKYGSSVEYGPVLKRALIDMVPINCFCMENDLCFFDQEFARDDCPAGYVMYRTLIYTYMYLPKIEQAVPMETLKRRYRLEDAWQAYEQEEHAFIESNRNIQIYGQFYKWSEIDPDCIYKKILGR